MNEDGVVVLTCPFDHRFAAIENHPVGLDGTTPVCPHCYLANLRSTLRLNRNLSDMLLESRNVTRMEDLKADALAIRDTLQHLADVLLRATSIIKEALNNAPNTDSR